LFIGLFLGFVSRLMFEAFQFAGTLVSTQMGLGMSQIVDPESGQQASPIGNIYTLVAIVIFLNLNGHHMLISALYKSFELAPLYSANVLENAARSSTARMFNDIFVIGVKLAAPSMVTLFLIEVSTGILARIVPQMNIFFVALPLRLGVGLFIVIATLPIFYVFFRTLLSDWQRDISGILMYF
jgi:flagellar biosynthetic protein FliR